MKLNINITLQVQKNKKTDSKLHHQKNNNNNNNTMTIRKLIKVTESNLPQINRK